MDHLFLWFPNFKIFLFPYIRSRKKNLSMNKIKKNFHILIFNVSFMYFLLSLSHFLKGIFRLYCCLSHPFHFSIIIIIDSRLMMIENGLDGVCAKDMSIVECILNKGPCRKIDFYFIIIIIIVIYWTFFLVCTQLNSNPFYYIGRLSYYY